MKNLATFKLENILSSDGITEMKVWEKDGIYTVTTGSKTPDFSLDNYGCEDSDDLMRLAKRSLKRVTEDSKNEVINLLKPYNTTAIINLTTKQIEQVEKLNGNVHLNDGIITFDVKNQVYSEHCEDEQRIWNELKNIIPEIDGALQGNPWDESDMSQIYFKLS